MQSGKVHYEHAFDHVLLHALAAVGAAAVLVQIAPDVR